MRSLHDQAWSTFEAILDERLNVIDSWNKLIDVLSNLIPAEYWDQIRALDLSADNNVIRKQMETIVSASPIPKEIVALWVGIVKLVNDEKEFYSLYLAGANQYDDEDAEWAVDSTYFPENRYIDSTVLNEVDSIIQKDDSNYSLLDWILPVAYTAFSINDIIGTNINKQLFLKFKSLFLTKYKELLFVTVGYDDGDFINVSPISVS